ncbi:MAG: UTRA domain-containing protein [Pseudomonadota bacterium]
MTGGATGRPTMAEAAGRRLIFESDAPAWRTIRDEARRRIAAGDWRRGATIPTEAALAREFGCSRGTVARAMRDLADAGLVERRKRGGTRVSDAPVRQARGAIPLIREEIAATGAAYGYARLLTQHLPAPDAVAARFRGAGRLMRVAAVHFAAERPFVLEDRWINLTLVPAAARAGFKEESANEWLVRRAPFTHGEQWMSAERADVVEARSLGIREGAPVFVVERTTFAAEEVVTVARLSYAAGYRARLEI